MSELLVERDGAVAIVTLNRPQAMNALSRNLRAAITEAIRSLDTDPEIRVVILTGAGDRAFSAGLDLRELGTDAGTLDAENASSDALNPVRAVENCSKPVIGAINGVAITGGLELALACDILIASKTARFADTHARVGLMPGWGLSQKLPRIIGKSRAKEMAFTGIFIRAEQALDWGLVNQVLDPKDLLARAIEIAQLIAEVDPAFATAYKRLIDDGFGIAFAEAVKMESERSTEFNALVTPEEIENRRDKVQARGRKQQKS